MLILRNWNVGYVYSYVGQATGFSGKSSSAIIVIAQSKEEARKLVEFAGKNGYLPMSVASQEKFDSIFSISEVHHLILDDYSIEQIQNFSTSTKLASWAADNGPDIDRCD